MVQAVLYVAGCWLAVVAFVLPPVLRDVREEDAARLWRWECAFERWNAGSGGDPGPPPRENAARVAASILAWPVSVPAILLWALAAYMAMAAATARERRADRAARATRYDTAREAREYDDIVRFLAAAEDTTRS